MDTAAPLLSKAASKLASAVVQRPYSAAFYAGCGLVMLSPELLSIPALGSLGFTYLGPAAGSLAAWVQTATTAAGSTFAILESAAMGGTTIVNVVVAGGAALAAGAKLAVDFLW
ncbi:hypothetical protein IAT40_000361 [Kwoniella sp. CBS 6097]